MELMESGGPTKPIPEEVRALATFVEERVESHLRSVIWYDQGDFEILYGRADVLSRYSTVEIDEVIDELALESREKPLKEQLYTHGSLNCTIQCYEDGIEMHFVVSEGEGVAIGLDADAFVTNATFLGTCIEKVALDD